jgi:hypothetical protein
VVCIITPRGALVAGLSDRVPVLVHCSQRDCPASNPMNSMLGIAYSRQAALHRLGSGGACSGACWFVQRMLCVSQLNVAIIDVCATLQDEIEIVSALAGAFQAACNANPPPPPGHSHLMPMLLRASLPNLPSAPRPTLHGTLLRPAAAVNFTPLHCARVYQCALAATLMHPTCSHAATDAAVDSARMFRSGLLSIEQTRELVPLVPSDPLVRPPAATEPMAANASRASTSTTVFCSMPAPCCACHAHTQ